MIQSIGQYNIPNIGATSFNAATKPQMQPAAAFSPVYPFLPSQISSNALNNTIDTKLTKQEDIEKYNTITKALITSSTEKTSPVDNVLRQKKLDALLKNGTLLNKNSNDLSTVLDNLYRAVTTPRAADMDGVKIAGQIIDALYNPAIITQRFGDVPNEARIFIGNKEGAYEADSVNTEGSGTCVAASVEFHMANKHPAEFARWAESLTSPEMSVEKDVNLSALSSNTMNAVWLLREFGVKPEQFNFYKAKLNLKPDANAITRAQIQDNYWDMGERSIIDVMIQSTLMQLGSQQSYNSLTDIRGGKFNSNPQGLIEFEKTFIESIVENNERTSIVYQNVDNDQNLLGWNCDLSTIQKHITDTIDSGEDVIIGYVLTAKECNEPASNPNKIVNGHEITIVDYKKDLSGKLIFVCNDTDDDKPHLVEYPADYLLPKIHHAGYPVQIVEENQNGILKSA